MKIGIGYTVPHARGGHVPPNPGFEYDPIVWCEDDGPNIPVVSGDPGGVFTVVPSIAGFNSATGEIPANTAAGSYAVTYEVNGVSETDTITINPDVSTTFTYDDVENRFSIFPNQAVSTPGIYTFVSSPSGNPSPVFANGSTSSSSGLINANGFTLGAYEVRFQPNSSCGNPTTTTFNVVQAFESFEFTIETTTPNETFTIPTTGTGYSYKVDWGQSANNYPTNFVGQGNTSIGANYTGNATSPVYSAAGTYNIKIGILNNTFPRIFFNGLGDKAKLRDVTSWGEIQWSDFNGSFKGCVDLGITATNSPDLSNCVSLTNAFSDTTNFVGSSSMNNWDTSNITGMSSCFYRSGFNSDISNWNTSNVTSMSWMFRKNSSFNQPINTNYLTNSQSPTGSAYTAWDVSNVTNFSYFLSEATAFNQDIGNFKLKSSGTIDMQLMFYSCSNFNQDINTSSVTVGPNTYAAWDTARVTSFSQMFFQNTNFNSSVSKWNTSNVTNMSYMFYSCSNFNQDINTKYYDAASSPTGSAYTAWDMSGVTSLGQMLRASKFNQSIDKWQFNSSLTSFNQFMRGASDFNQPINTQTVTVGPNTYTAWDVSNITGFDLMFYGCADFNQPLNNWNTGSATNMSNMFFQCGSFDQSLAAWDISNVSSFGGQFGFLLNLSTTNYDATLVSWNNQNVQTLTQNVDFGDSVPSCDNAASNGAFAARANLMTSNKWNVSILDKFSINNTCQPLAGFDYISNAYCTNGSDVSPTITGTIDQTLPLGGTISDAWSSSDYFQSFKFKVTTQTTNETFTFNGSGSYHIDWGDGNGFQGPYTNAQSFQYSTIGQQNTVTVGQSGDELNLIYVYGDANVAKITEISQWMEGFNTSVLRLQHTSTRFAPLNITATNVPGFKDVGSGGAALYRIFANLPSTNGMVDSGDNLSKWNLDNVTSIGQFFGPSGGGIPTSFNPNTKQVAYNNETYLAWDIKNCTTVYDCDIATSTAPNNWNTSSVTNFRELRLQNIQVPYQSVTVGSRTYNQWDISAGTSFGNIFGSSFDNTSPKDWILGSQLSNTTNSLWFSYPAAWGGASNQSDNYTNCWIGWAITIYNGVASKGYSQNYLTNLNLSGAHVHYDGKFNNSLAINSTLHPNAPSSWFTAQDAADYLVNTQGWTVNTGFF
jgi:surface protein